MKPPRNHRDTTMRNIISKVMAAAVLAAAVLSAESQAAQRQVAVQVGNVRVSLQERDRHDVRHCCDREAEMRRHLAAERARIAREHARRHAHCHICDRARHDHRDAHHRDKHCRR